MNVNQVLYYSLLFITFFHHSAISKNINVVVISVSCIIRWFYSFLDIFLEPRGLNTAGEL